MRRSGLKRFKRLGLTAVALDCMLLSACMVGPDFDKPAAPASEHYDVEAENHLVKAAGVTELQHVELGERVPGNWWLVFDSAALDRVMYKAIEGNLELEAADAAVAQAKEVVAQTRGGLAPQLDFGAEAARQGISGAPDASISNAYAFGPQVSFDFDLFGGVRRQVQEETALVDVQKHRFDAAYLLLTGDVARQVFMLASASAQIDAVRALLDDDHRNLDLVRTAHAYGSATQVDIALATTQLERDQTLLPPLAQQRDVARHALSALAGKGPADWVTPDFVLSDFTLPPTLPVSLPSELARQRPDILAAEARLRAASSAVGVATADLYPHLVLTASVDHAGPGIGTLWAIAAGLTAPIFHGGSLQANRRASVDAYKVSLAAYRQTVVSSLMQVADVLQAISHDTDEYGAQSRSLAAAASSLRLNRAGYLAGETGVLQVLDAERTYQQASIGQIRARTALYVDTVQLSIALGGNASGAFERRVAYRDVR